MWPFSSCMPSLEISLWLLDEDKKAYTEHPISLQEFGWLMLFIMFLTALWCSIKAFGYGRMLTHEELSWRTFPRVNTAPLALSHGVEWTALRVIITNEICFFQTVTKMVVVLEGSCQKSSMCLPEKEITTCKLERRRRKEEAAMFRWLQLEWK